MPQSQALPACSHHVVCCLLQAPELLAHAGNKLFAIIGAQRRPQAGDDGRHQEARGTLKSLRGQVIALLNTHNAHIQLATAVTLKLEGAEGAGGGQAAFDARMCGEWRRSGTAVPLLCVLHHVEALPCFDNVASLESRVGLWLEDRPTLLQPWRVSTQLLAASIPTP